MKPEFGNTLPDISAVDDWAIFFLKEPGGYREYIMFNGQWNRKASSLPLNENVLALLSDTNIPLNANGDTIIYTVPGGKRCILHSALLVLGADAGTSDLSIGQAGATTDFLPVQNLDNLNAQYDVGLLMPVPSATPALPQKSYSAGTIIKATVANQAGGATNKLFLYGTLY